MASKQTTVDFLLDQVQSAGMVSARKMFGEYALYCDQKVVALVCDDQLFVKPTIAGQQILGEPELAPPYPGAKPYFHISGDFWDDAEWLANLISETAKELPLPKKKRAA